MVTNCDHLHLFRRAQLEHEIRRKTLWISLDGLIECLGRNAIEPRKVGGQYHPLSAKDEYRFSDLFGHRAGRAHNNPRSANDSTPLPATMK